MTELVNLERLPEWVPGRILLASDGLGWRQVGLRAYHYEGQDVVVPAMRDYMLVSYCEGATPMQRRFDGRWRRDTLTPGAASLLTRAQRAHWEWREAIDVTHLYLAPALVNAVASEVLDCHVAEVRLEDVLRTEDPVITATVAAVAAEARQQALGGPMYVDALARGLIVHLLRRYACVEGRERGPAAGLSPVQRRTIVDYIDANIGEALTLEAMATELGLGACAFARAFRRSFGAPPYAWVIARRIERARRLLVQTAEPIKAIAVACGFSDQAHLTRLFARERPSERAATTRGYACGRKRYCSIRADPLNKTSNGSPFTGRPSVALQPKKGEADVLRRNCATQARSASAETSPVRNPGMISAPWRGVWSGGVAASKAAASSISGYPVVARLACSSGVQRSGTIPSSRLASALISNASMPKAPRRRGPR